METPSAKNLFTAENIKKYFPLILLLILTFALMLFFKSNKKGISSMIEEGKKNLLSLYTGGLRPLISETEISKEDLFNFALYQSLPVDQAKNKVLVLSNNDGQQVYEIKPANFNQNTKNYEAFKSYLELNGKQREIADSVLNSYRKDIYSCVLVNDKNAYAVNPKIGEIQQAMLADLVYIAQKANSDKAQEIFPEMANVGRAQLLSLIKSGKEITSTQYLLMTPDTVTKADFTWDEDKFNEQLRAFEEGKFAAAEFAKNQAFTWSGDVTPPTPPSTGKHINRVDYKIDSNKYKITFDYNELSKMINDSLKVSLEKAAKQLKSISVRVPGYKGSHSRSNEIRIVPPIPEGAFVSIDPVDITEKTLKMVSSLNIPQLVEDAMRHDSSFQAAMKDSAKSKKFQEKMKELKRELKKLNVDSIKN
ncbi:MAG: hypothetical protein Q8S39_10430 [Ignavibacteria bacterium]|nr:hypothetical protein [Ignavibacteria bacterium]MDP3582339.1 hypothetical protein [Ignavibacteria bacterium]